MNSRIEFTVSGYFYDPLDPENGGEFAQIVWAAGNSEANAEALGIDWPIEFTISPEASNEKILSTLGKMLRDIMLAAGRTTILA